MKIVTKIQHFKDCKKERNIVTKSFGLFQHFKSFLVLSKLLKIAFFISIFKKNRAFNVLKLQCFTIFSKKV